MASDHLDIGDPAFWRRPHEDRMADLAVIREQGPFARSEEPNPLTGTPDVFHAVTRHADVLEVSRRPADFCSGRGSIAIADMPAEVMEYFGSFITMDDPRHARQRGVVARSFTPRALQRVMDSVEAVCVEVIDDVCERGEADLVEAIAAPFPLLIICDMMGIPRSEFATVLDATNVILGAGDPETTGGRDVLEAMLDAGAQLTSLMAELVEFRRVNPTDDLTSALVHGGGDEEVLAPHEIPPFFILLAVAGNDTTRTAITSGVHVLAQHPDQRARWQADHEVTGTAVEEIIRFASPVTYMRRTVTRPLTLSGHDFSEGDRLVLFYGAANRDPRVFDEPERFDVRRDPNPHVGFGGPGPHFCLGAHLARRELSVMFPQLLDRLPDLEVTGEPAYLEAQGVPLVGGIKRLPVRFTPTARRARADA